MNGFVAGIRLETLEVDPYPTLARLRAEEPVAYLPGLQTWMITRFEDVQEALRDSETFTSEWGAPIDEIIGSHRVDGSSGAAHARYRRGLSGSLAPKAVEVWARTLLFPLVESRLDALEGLGEADLVDALLEPLSVLAFQSLLGVPGLDPEMLRHWLHGLSVGASNMAGDPAAAAQARATSEEIDRMLWPYLEAVDGKPDGGLVSHLLEHAQGDTLAERVHDVMPSIKTAIGAGEQEPGDGAGTAIAGILSHEDARTSFRVAPGKHVASAVEEALRWVPPIQQIGRRTTRETEIGGTTIPARAMVTLSLASANRDRAVWGELADEYRLDRLPSRHLGFGFGMHFCAGNYVGRVVMRHTLQRLFERIPDIRLDPCDEVCFTGAVFRKLTRLAAVWP